ncbi:hypothetical protein JVT61DRAFT_647 [Boletus reticuloceps]|uniref:Uncharacterized protein n=1 Tax=Boletus reticuloceps TaxID=495285 RepID=A0A8I2Z046_9AGAM|nr:hypothetical protein JVT61DRAFT_647 [Boletus reticuloceps]
MARSQSDSYYPQDPILQFRPPFVQSLPIQVLVTGITLTLAAVLLFHLVFTAQYHWPLARTNYALQLTGVATLLISTSATLWIIFSATVRQSQHWPYMLSYLAIEMPSANHSANSTDPTLLYQQIWTPAERATWVVMNATTSVVVQITHIHFLTLLFPSDLEARLIFGLIGPLAVISAVMQLLPLISSDSVASIAEDTRNVCNAALSVLFTAFLIIWGFFAAIILAFISTSLNFVYIPRQDQYTWMPKLMWAVTLWQSFFGWWWWVGAGMGVREVEELLERENKRQQKRLLRTQRRKEQREKAKSVWKGVTDAFKPNTKADASARTPSQDGESMSTATVLGWSAVFNPLQMVQRWYARLRHAHLTAAHIQAAERAERMHQVYQREEERNPYQKPVVGWGLGSFSVREAERERREEVEMEVRIPREEDEEEWEDDPAVHDSMPEPQLRYRGTRASPPVQLNEQSTGSSLWWWGPLRQWRLKDSTTYR